MKKFSIVVLCMVMVFVLSACGMSRVVQTVEEMVAGNEAAQSTEEMVTESEEPQASEKAQVVVEQPEGTMEFGMDDLVMYIPEGSPTEDIGGGVLAELQDEDGLTFATVTITQVATGAIGEGMVTEPSYQSSFSNSFFTSFESDEKTADGVETIAGEDAYFMEYEAVAQGVEAEGLVYSVFYGGRIYSVGFSTYLGAGEMDYFRELAQTIHFV